MRCSKPPTAIVSSSGWGAKTTTRAVGDNRRASTGCEEPTDASAAVHQVATRSATTIDFIIPPTGRRPHATALTTSHSLCQIQKQSTSDLVALHQPPRDDEALDLVGSLTDDHERRIPVVALDRELLRVSIPAEHPHRLQRDLLAGLGREELGHARL